MYTIALSAETIIELAREHDGSLWNYTEFLFMWSGTHQDLQAFYSWFAKQFDASLHRVRQTNAALRHRYRFIARFKTEREAAVFLLRWA